jgi:hypothetical protein
MPPFVARAPAENTGAHASVSSEGLAIASGEAHAYPLNAGDVGIAPLFPNAHGLAYPVQLPADCAAHCQRLRVLGRSPVMAQRGLSAAQSQHKINRGIEAFSIPRFSRCAGALSTIEHDIEGGALSRDDA